ncbi:MAG: YncE family protein [Proteobacteria bacterium]|nr:MAG: YncE family protein [Pseudomonadota bacterium]QKK10697.1 MAG: YncE family protein [Pseudomonadota bacterium]
MIHCTLRRRCVTGVATLTLALAPLGLLAAPIVYVPAGEANRVLVIDSAIDQVVGNIDGVLNTHGLASDPAGKRLLAGSLKVRDVSDAPAKPAGVTEDEHQAHHAASANPVVPSVTSSDLVGTVYLIDVSGKRIVRQIDVPGSVHHNLITVDGRYGISTHPTAGVISVIDLNTGELATQVATGVVPNYVVSNREGSRLWVSNTGNNTVSEIDTRRWIVRRNLIVDQSPEHMVLSPDESSLYVIANGAGQVVELDLVSGEIVRRHPVGSDPHGIDISDDGTQLYVAIKGDNKLAAIQLNTGVVRALPLGPDPYHLATIKDTGKVYVSSRKDSKLWVVSQRDLKLVGEIPISGIGHQMVVMKK